MADKIITLTRLQEYDKLIKEYTDTAIANLVNGAPETLDTLDELASALNDNVDILDVLNESIGTKASQSDLTKLTNRVGTLEQSSGQLDGYVTKNTNDITQLKTDVEALETTTASHTTSISTLETGFETLSDDCNTAIGKANQAIQDCTTVSGQITNKAPTAHASTDKTYGVGTGTSYGHVKLATGDVYTAPYSDGLACSIAHSHSQYYTSADCASKSDIEALFA